MPVSFYVQGVIMEVVLVDAFSQIFRGYYAIRHLSDSQGRPTNAIFAFTKLSLQLQRLYPSQYGAMVFDCGEVAFRTDIAPNYKANRSPTPEDLLAQLPAIRTLVAVFGWKLVEAVNYEADDLIAGAAGMFAGREVGIVSQDKDLAQLVTATTRLLRPAKPAGFSIWGGDEVVGKFGVRPEQIVDYLAIVGDSSDNIPGVPGIGEKGAANILSVAGSLSQFFEDPSVIANEKIRGKLLENRELLALNLKLVGLRSDLPAAFAETQAWVRCEPDWAEIRRIGQEYELGSILRELPEVVVKKDEAPADKELSQGMFDF